MGSEWTQVSLGAVCEKIGSGATPRGGASSYKAQGVSLIRSQNIHNFGFKDDGLAFIDDAQAAALDNVEVREHDVLLNITGDSVARSCQVPTRVLPARVNQHVAIIRPKVDQLDHRFIRYVMIEPAMQAHLLSLAGSGGTRNALTKGMIEGIQITFPSLPEQRAIAHVLGALDDKIELNRRMNETLEEMARAVFKSWFVDFDPVIDNALRSGNPIPPELQERADKRLPMIGKPPSKSFQRLEKSARNFPTIGKNAEKVSNDWKTMPADLPTIGKLFPDCFQESELGWIPEGWEVGTVGAMTANFDSRRIPISGRERSKRKGPYPYYGAASVMDHIDSFIFDGIYCLVGEDGSVVRNDGRAVTQYVWGKLWVNNHAHVLQGKDFVSTEYVYLFWHFNPVEAYVTGAVQPKLSQGRMNSIPCVLPPRDVHVEFAHVVQSMFRTIRSNVEESHTLAALRDTLLPKLLSGEVRIKDAEKMVEEAT